MSSSTALQPLQRLPFPPITRAHILHCSYDYWHPLLRAVTPKARLIPLTDAFLDYLRADGIILTPDETITADDDSGVYTDSDSDDEDPSAQWREIHTQIRDAIAELGGKVIPKLNWSAPKDATFMSATNDMECRTPNDIYLLLKSSDFVTHDLEQAFDGCVEGESGPVPYHLVLRKSFNLNPALEFRCFVRNRTLLAITQREMNHFAFLFELRSNFLGRIRDFLDDRLLPKFPDKDFVFDVYIPPPHERVWLIDINPWAPRTDPLLFSWLELLQMSPDEPDPAREDSSSEEEEYIFEPEFRLIERDDPEAYQFGATKYSAHKLPKEVVDASLAPGSTMKDLMEEWKRALNRQVEEEEEEEDSTRAGPS